MKLALIKIYILAFNPSLHWFLDHDIVFYFQTTLKKIKKKLSYVLNKFEDITVNGAFDDPFSVIFSNT